jgi:hypothetical protein
MRGDEARIVQAFHEHLEAAGWTVTREVDFCDLVGERDGGRLFAEAKGRTQAVGVDSDTMYGQLLRRMPITDDTTARFVVVIPVGSLTAALRVPRRVRELLRIDVYSVDEEGQVAGPTDV